MIIGQPLQENHKSMIGLRLLEPNLIHLLLGTGQSSPTRY